MHSQYHRPNKGHLPIRHFITIIILLLLLGFVAKTADISKSSTSPSHTDEARWWKGNIHTHTLWSDGNHYPENIVDHYKSSGYHFLALSDHNILSISNNKWIDVKRSSGGMEAYEKYVNRFGSAWIDQLIKDDVLYVRLKTLEEIRGLFEEPEKFLLIQAEEISKQYIRSEQVGTALIQTAQTSAEHSHHEHSHHEHHSGGAAVPLHIVAINTISQVSVQAGKNVMEVLQNSIDAVAMHSQQSNQPMLSVIAHPNFQDAINAKDIVDIEEAKFFEVYNGHIYSNNTGNNMRPGTEGMWDTVLTERFKRGGKLIYGVAVDDTHTYHETDSNCCNAKRGWVVVRAQKLTADTITLAMDSGDFYSSTGVELKDIQHDNSQTKIAIKAEEGVSYSTQFIGTRIGSNKSGVILATEAGTEVSYRFACNEMYVRAKVTSSKRHADPSQLGEMEVAWTQPIQIENCIPNIYLPLISKNQKSKSANVFTTRPKSY